MARAWKMVEPNAPLDRVEFEPRPPAAGEVLLRVIGCGVCHTDLSFLHGDVRPRAGLPLVLGHEIVGEVLEGGDGADQWVGRQVVVPAVIPCGECDLCRRERDNACQAQVMPGNDCDGGFATHATLPARGLAPVGEVPEGTTLEDFAVIADAVSTALQAVRRAKVGPGDVVIVVGAGGVGGYAVQTAAAAGATVFAIDVNAARLELIAQHGAAEVVDAKGLSPKDVRKAVRSLVSERDLPRIGWKIFECSGVPAGQQTAYALLVPTATLAIVGFTHEPVSVRLSNLMAFDADAFGSWGCPPRLYGDAIELVRDGKVALAPFTKHVPMDSIEDALAEAHSGKDGRRLVLTA